MKEAILITLLLSTLLAFYEYNKIDIVGTELSSDIDDESNNVNIDYVRDLDIERYMGLWYVIASKPNIIEKYCKCARTEDVLVDDSTIELAETCWLLGNFIKFIIIGKKITSRSKAIIEEPRTGHWTNVVKAIKADYWVIDVSPDYSWSVVGQPKGKGCNQHK